MKQTTRSYANRDSSDNVYTTEVRTLELDGHKLEIHHHLRNGDEAGYSAIFDNKALPIEVPFLDTTKKLPTSIYEGEYLEWYSFYALPLLEAQAHELKDPKKQEKELAALEVCKKMLEERVLRLHGLGMAGLYAQEQREICAKQTQEYVEKRLKAGEKPDLYAKTARISARPGKVGEEIVTKMQNGHVETRNTIQKKGDMVATNPGGEQYIIDAETFQKRYEVDPANPKQYRPKGGAQEFLPATERLRFLAPWGEWMDIQAGGVLNISGRAKGDIYGIQATEFADTYGRCDKNGTILSNFSMRDFLKAMKTSLTRKPKPRRKGGIGD